MKIRNEVKVGIFTLVVLILFYVSITFLKGADLFSYKDNKYFVVYDKGGSKPGDGISINGILVGSVIKTELIKETFKLKVHFKIEKGIILTDKCMAILSGPGLIPGRNSISIKFADQDGEPLKPGSEIKGIINQSFTEEIMSSTLPLLDEVKSTSALISELAGSLAKNQLKINSAIANLEFLTYNIKDYILKNKDFFDDITKSVATILSGFADEKKGLGSVISQMTTSLNKVNDLDIKEINNSIKQFKSFMIKIQKKGTTFGDLINKGDLYQNLNKTLVSLEELLSDLRVAPHRYVHFSVFGKKPVRSK
ncbi:MAG: MCE family protein [Bacteroidetes bacterium]|nr:MCE family protein [Bacteroidota bacterium]